MDFFDILWLLICIGLPVISGIASAKKKNAGKGKSVPQNSEVPAESDLKEIFKSIIEEKCPGVKCLISEINTNPIIYL